MATIGNSRDRLARRLGQLYVGLALYGVSMALMIESTLGLDPWDVFHQGLSRFTGASIGTVTIVVGALVLLLWIPLRQRPGLGTLSNVVVIGLAVDLALAVLPTVGSLPARIGFVVAGILLNGVATGLYIGARLGPGPRDGLVTGYVARRPHQSIRLVRTVVEVTVLAIGFLLGGKVGIGTVAYALAIGPLVHTFIPMFTVRPVTVGPVATTRPVTVGPTTETGIGQSDDRRRESDSRAAEVAVP
ncbi:YitT family protein [Plantactinospora solaniradicis]|uniref:YitT family protein n=1 Tax=Plantactinospora solaniradicis TaxID=1723736 RepID=A0ABW1KGW6_9ACTN